jgi:hypothetical protein
LNNPPVKLGKARIHHRRETGKFIETPTQQGLYCVFTSLFEEIHMKAFNRLLLSGLVLTAVHVTAEEPVDWDMVNEIRAEGFHRSDIMDTIKHLTDVIGPRITNSPQQREASEWTRQRLEDYGLKNAELEEWGEFGRGWSFTRADIQLIEPIRIPLFALPKAWTPGRYGWSRRGGSDTCDGQERRRLRKVRR